jgi:peroxiredoxin
VPDFTLSAAGGGSIRLSDIQGDFALLAFQPKSDSKGVLEKMADVILNSGAH